MHVALYRSERPERFDEIIGQRHIVNILRNQLRSGSVSQAYLFTGTRGTGKTTTARILAKAVNCTGTQEADGLPCGCCENCRAIRDGRFLDVVELDAASNNGVDNLRAIIDSAQYPPTVGKYKVYIIDEVHMLSQAAENAFLKTLEEPPEHVIFILATTDPEKVRSTIRSRCMTLRFRRVSEDELLAGMQAICARRDVQAEEEALRVIAVKADGSVRDALSILEQCMALGVPVLTRDAVLDEIGSAGRDVYLSLTADVHTGRLAEALETIDRLVRSGKDARQLLADWLAHWRDLMVAKYVADPQEILHASTENTERLRTQAAELSAEEIARAVTLLSEQVNAARYSAQPRILLEMAAVKLLRGEPQAVSTAPRQPAAPLRETPSHSAVASGSEKPGTEKEAEAEPKPLFETPAAPPAEVDDRHIGELEAENDLDERWARVLDAISDRDSSYRIMVGPNSRLTDCRNDEWIVTVKPNKLVIAESKRGELDRIVKELYGERSYITFRAGEVTPVPQAERPNEAFDLPGEKAHEEAARDAVAEELAQDVSALLGVEVDITE